jgi:hypothetical protein
MRQFLFYLVCEAIGTAATPGLFCQPRVIVKMMMEKQMECRLAGETEVLREKTCPSATFVHRKIPHDQTRVWTRAAAAVGSRRLTAWAVARPNETVSVWLLEDIDPCYWFIRTSVRRGGGIACCTTSSMAITLTYLHEYGIDRFVAGRMNWTVKPVVSSTGWSIPEIFHISVYFCFRTWCVHATTTQVLMQCFLLTLVIASTNYSHVYFKPLFVLFRSSCSN